MDIILQNFLINADGTFLEKKTIRLTGREALFIPQYEEEIFHPQLHKTFPEGVEFSIVSSSPRYDYLRKVIVINLTQHINTRTKWPVL